MRILFLGAGKLWQLLQLFIEDAKDLGISLDLHSIELSKEVPISQLATIHVGPKFTATHASDAIRDLATALNVDIVVPNADSGTVALAAIAQDLRKENIECAVSSHTLCTAMYDKILAEAWFSAHRDPRPLPTSHAPAIAKYRFGYASRGIYHLPTQSDFDAFAKRTDFDDFLVQEYIEGDEFSVDAYVDGAGRVIDILVRQRLTVEAGIVVDSVTVWHDEIVAACKTILSRAGWKGPQTLQFRVNREGPKLIEINPRFGGGVTHAIHCGLRMPRWLMLERLGKTIAHTPFVWKRGSLMTRARIDIFHDYCN